MLYVIREAVDLYRNHADAFGRLRLRAMTGDFSWARSAKEYLRIYASVTGQVWPAPVQETPAEKPKRKTAAGKTKKSAKEADGEKKPAGKTVKKPAAKKTAKKEAVQKETTKKGPAKTRKKEQAE